MVLCVKIIFSINQGQIGEETLTAYQPLIVKYASADFNEIPLLEPGSVLPSRDIPIQRYDGPRGFNFRYYRAHVHDY